MADWQRRTFWAVVFVGIMTMASAISSFEVRIRVDANNQAWQKRLDALESEMTVLRNAKVAQDEFNAGEIRMWEKLQGRR